MASGLSKKIGPLPLWGWGVGGAGAYYLYQKSKGGKTPTLSKIGGKSGRKGKRGGRR